MSEATLVAVIGAVVGPLLVLIVQAVIVRRIGRPNDGGSIAGDLSRLKGIVLERLARGDERLDRLERGHEQLRASIEDLTRTQTQISYELARLAALHETERES